MKGVFRWAIRNTPAMNTLLVGVLVVGLYSLVNLRREVFPEFKLEVIKVSVPYPGATPAEVEEGICQKIEEAVHSIAGIKKINSVAAEGMGTVVLELESSADPLKLLNEVRSEVDRISTFPELAEDPQVKQMTIRRPAIRVGVLGPDDTSLRAELALRDLAEQIRDEILLLPSVSQAELVGVRPYQIDVEISEATLRKYGLTLRQVADTIRRQNVELPGGTLRSESQEILLRGKNKGLTGKEIAQLPLLTQPDGVVLTVGDLGTVRDGLADVTAISRINGRPAVAIEITKTETEDLLAITREVKEYVARRPMPPGYELVTWDDISVMVRDRLSLLARNGLQGLLVVLFFLTVFLEIRLAFWVALGIPVAMLGACAAFYGMDQSLNMLSMFAFIMALGILVDDGIVIGENVYAHREMGKTLVDAAVDGTHEVLPSVFASVTTTIIAFGPLLFVPGVMGKFIRIMPIGVITMLVVSLLEAMFVLPCHLAHGPDGRRRRRSRAARVWGLVWRVGVVGLAVVGLAVLKRIPLPFEVTWKLWALLVALALLPSLAYPFHFIEQGTAWVNRVANRALSYFIERLYTPVLRLTIRWPTLTVCTGLAVLLLGLGVVAGGVVPFVPFPKLDANTIQATIYYPDGTPESVTDRATQILEQAIRDVDRRYRQAGMPIIVLVHRMVGQIGGVANRTTNEPAQGSHSGRVQVEIVPPDQRTVTSEEIIQQWRQRAHELAKGFPGAESVKFEAAAIGPGGPAIEFRLLGRPDQMKALEEAVERCKAFLAQFPGVYDIEDDARPGKWEYQFRVKEEAKALGITTADLAEAVRAAYYGEEVMRLQRGRHEVKLMVRYPPDERRSVRHLENMRIRIGGVERPITEVADITVTRGYSQIIRLDQRRSITITADVDETVTNSQRIVRQLKTQFLPQLLSDPRFDGILVRWGGTQEETAESISGLITGLMIALVLMFALLTLEFESYAQPLLILAIIPFGIIGAIVGHLIMGLPLTLFSLFGLVALTGVVVNDSIVLIDFINHRLRDGMGLYDALVDAGQRRFRPVLLTSVTTVGGLAPLLLEKSFQAQVLIPMATSLSFGLMFTTVLVLLLVPSFYAIYARVVGLDGSEDLRRALPSRAEPALQPDRGRTEVAVG